MGLYITYRFLESELFGIIILTKNIIYSKSMSIIHNFMIMDYITFKNRKGADVDMTDVSHFSKAYEFLISDQLDFGG